jgi:hypothetical protein
LAGTDYVDRPVFAFSKEFGSVGAQSVSTLFSLGLTQDNAISFLGEGSSLTSVPSLWKSYFSSGLDAVRSFGHNVEKKAPTDHAI